MLWKLTFSNTMHFPSGDILRVPKWEKYFGCCQKDLPSTLPKTGVNVTYFLMVRWVSSALTKGRTALIVALTCTPAVADVRNIWGRGVPWYSAECPWHTPCTFPEGPLHPGEGYCVLWPHLHCVLTPGSRDWRDPENHRGCLAPAVFCVYYSRVQSLP